MSDLNPKMIKCFFCAEEILIDAKKCKHCGEWVKNNENINLKEKKKKTGIYKEYGMNAWGVIFIVLGLISVYYFLIVFDTSVEVPRTEILGQTFGGQRVNNLGLMQDRQNFIMLSIVIIIIGVIMSIADKFKNKNN